MSDIVKDAMQKGLIELMLNELCKSGVSKDSFTLTSDDRDLLDDNEDELSFGVTVKVKSFNTDDGPTREDQHYFITVYNKDDQQFYLIWGEDEYVEITYGNLYSFMYFSSIELIAQ